MLIALLISCTARQALDLKVALEMSNFLSLPTKITGREQKCLLNNYKTYAILKRVEGKTFFIICS
jgi:hypothetical protein